MSEKAKKATAKTSKRLVQRLAQSIKDDELRQALEPVRITGVFLNSVKEAWQLRTTELSAMLGWNNSAIYRKVSKDEDMVAAACILLRCATVMPEHTTLQPEPTPQRLIELIQQCEPGFGPENLGLVLGLGRTSSNRLGKGFDQASQTVRMLALFIIKALEKDPKNWLAIKACIEIEAESRGITPGATVWEQGWFAKKQGGV